ncbi:MAG: FKBP-type peptidyl-prolyl cis-trans isomerase [Arenicellales bacterium]|nr:FKBP-type peptidyl-prolyl cis-trans isomerase [Arenicellales bacterium]
MTKIVLSVTPLLVALLIGSSAMADDVPQTSQEQFSYALGFQIGSQIAQQMKADNLDLDPAHLAQAIEDVLAGRAPAMTDEQMAAAITEARKHAQEETMAKSQGSASAGAAFRAEYKQREGVSTTDSGILYTVLVEGTGKQPQASDTVVVHYRGTLIDGTEFDSSFKRNQPATFSLGGIIPGWQEILQLMPEGSRWEVVIPPELAYGSAGAGGVIGPEETLVFEIELREIK